VIRRRFTYMKPLLASILAVLAVAVSGMAAPELPEPRLSFSQMPQYPPLARAARIEGSVKLNFLVDDKGNVASVEAMSGHPMLKSAAADIVKSWRFDLPRDLYRTEWRYETEFVYRLSGREVERNARLTISLDSFHRVEITTDKAAVQYVGSHEPGPKQQ
jgi:TonB family protein